MKRTITLWSKRILNLEQKVVAINAKILSKFTYAALVRLLPKACAKQIDKIVVGFLFGGRPAYSSTPYWKLRKTEGGLNILDPLLHNKALLIKRLSLLWSSSAPWSKAVEKVLGLKGKDHLNPDISLNTCQWSPLKSLWTKMSVNKQPQESSVKSVQQLIQEILNNQKPCGEPNFVVNLSLHNNIS